MHSLSYAVDLKSQVPQTCSFRMGQPRRWGGEREKFNDIVIAQSEVSLVRQPFLTIVFSKDTHAEHMSIEVETPLIVGTNDSDVMYFVQV
jgi:hypothetical protein